MATIVEIDAFREKARKDISDFINKYFDAAEKDMGIPKKHINIEIRNDAIKDMMGKYMKNNFNVNIKADYQKIMNK